MGHLVQPRPILLSSGGSSIGAGLVAEPVSTPANGTAAANTAVVLTVAGTVGITMKLTHLSWSYNAAPTGGRVFVQDGATTILDLDISSIGPGNVSLPPGGLKVTAGNTLTVTLAAAGAAVTGKLNIATFTGTP